MRTPARRAAVRSGVHPALDPVIVAELRTSVRGRVDDGARRRAEYSSDASNYRVVPAVVVEPVDETDVMTALEIGRRTGVPVTSRGGGTSVAGNAVGDGIVLDFSRHLDTILDLDPEARTARVQPGVVLAQLQRAASPHGLRFGPDPSTHARATLGGMIGNNACGPHAVAYGRTADNVEALDMVDGRGRRFTVGRGFDAVPGLDRLVNANLEILRTEFGRFPRQVSGYSLEHLLPERGRDLAKAIVGSEGTLGVTLGATVRLVEVSSATVLVVLGYPDMATAAEAVPAMLAHHPLAVEGLDARLVNVVRADRGAAAVPDLPRGAGWLMIELGGATVAEARAVASEIVRDAGALDHRVITSGSEAAGMWRIREDGAGLAGRTPAGRQAWPGWEDAAVPPERLGAYLREFDSLMEDYGVTGMPYGHFGDGCVHVRIDLPLDNGADVFHEFVLDAARLVVRHGGSCSGEHGDGRARGELLPLMYSERAIELFGRFKALFDPEELLSPGIVVRPHGLVEDLRRPQALPILADGGFDFAGDSGDFTTAVHRCVGVGKCRADSRAAGGFMCPSYLATRDEKDSTRGRARVLQELANGSLIETWSAPEVHESLDLCLSCKACSRDCPAGVDMAQYKSEVLHRTYRGVLRPPSHYSLGRLPLWTSMLGRIPRVGAAIANGVLRNRVVSPLVLRAGGIDPRRHVPTFAPTSFHRSWRSSPVGSGNGDPVVLWADTFSNSMSPRVAHAAARVLTDAGFRVIVPDEQACCGLTWISTGQLDGAQKRLRRLLDVLGPYAERGIPVVGVEPSCTAVLRSDLRDLLREDPRSEQVATVVTTLAELLSTRPGWAPPDLSGVELVVQPHCHHHSVMGFTADRRLLEAAGATFEVVSGCCGLAGNFGMEQGHYEISVAVAECALLPAVRALPSGGIVLADGFSCRTQLEQLAGLPAVHLAELLLHGVSSPRDLPDPIAT